VQIKSVLYIATQIVGTNKYFSGIHYPEIWYARLQRKIISVFKGKNHQAKLFVRFHPNEPTTDINKEWFQSHVDWATDVQETVVECLSNRTFDLIIIDCPSTTLLQALCTKSQIICFFPKKVIHLYEEAKKLLDKRVFVIFEEEDLLKSINSFLSDQLMQKQLNDEFLFAYGLGNQDENLMIRTKEAITSIIHEEKSQTSSKKGEMLS
jgi:hypothetical protein